METKSFSQIHIFIITIIILLLAIGFSVSADDEITSSISGYLSLEGKEIEEYSGVELVLSDGITDLSTVTDNVGYFDFNNLTDGTYFLFIRQDGYLNRWISNITVSEENLDIATLTSPLYILAGDIDGETGVDSGDLANLISKLGAIESDDEYDPILDFDSATGIDTGDLAIMIKNLGKTDSDYGGYIKVTDAYAVAIDEVMVELSVKSPEGVMAELAFGTEILEADVIWSTDRKSVEFHSDNELLPGEYTVTVWDTSRTFIIEEEEPTELAIMTWYIFPLSDQLLNIELHNQYGDIMELGESVSLTVLNPGNGIELTVARNGNIFTVDASNPDIVEAGDSLTVTVTQDSLVTITTILVFEAPILTSLETGSIHIAEDEYILFENTLGHILELIAYDQYGQQYKIIEDDLSINGGSLNILSSNESILPSSSFSINNSGDLSFDADEAGQVVISFIIPSFAYVHSTTIIVYALPELNSINLETGPGTIIAGIRNDLIAVAFDQYGSAIDLEGNFDFSKFASISSNTAIIPNGGIDYDEAEDLFYIEPLSPGTVTLTYYYDGVYQGELQVNDIVVPEPAVLDTLIINATGGMITSGSRYEFTSFAYDQYGESIPLLGNFDFSKFTMTSTNLLSVPMGSIQYDAVEGVMYLQPAAPGTSTVSYYYNGIYQGLMQIVVNDAAEPQYIQSVDFPANFEVLADKDIVLDDIVVRDQYNQVFDMDQAGYSIDIQVSSGSTAGLIGGNMITGSVNPTVRATDTEGTTTFTLTVMKNSVAVVGSQYAVQVTVVGTNDITSYAFDNVSLMYAGGSGATDYYKTLSISGRIGTQEVVLAGTGAVPDAITLLTSTNTNFTLNSTTLELYASAAGSTTIQAWVGGSPVASVVVTASATAPAVSSMVFNPSSYTLANNVVSYDLDLILTVLDQYGVNITSSASIFYSSTNPSVATVTQSGIVTTYGVDGTVSISVVELSGAGSVVLELIVE